MNNLKTIVTICALSWAFSPIVQAQTNNEKEEKPPMKEVCDFLKQCGKYFIATTEGNQPRVRPSWYGNYL
jgi:hypothetical protein